MLCIPYSIYVVHESIIMYNDVDLLLYKNWGQEEFEDTKGVIRIHISKKNRKHNGQKKSTKGQTTIYKTYTSN